MVGDDSGIDRSTPTLILGAMSSASVSAVAGWTQTLLLSEGRVFTAGPVVLFLFAFFSNFVFSPGKWFGHWRRFGLQIDSGIADIVFAFVLTFSVLSHWSYRHSRLYLSAGLADLVAPVSPQVCRPISRSTKSLFCE